MEVKPGQVYKTEMPAYMDTMIVLDYDSLHEECLVQFRNKGGYIENRLVSYSTVQLSVYRYSHELTKLEMLLL